jgi:outer membrane protein assembly factor BamE (lipoprotein component of BamABCDE complex)
MQRTNKKLLIVLTALALGLFCAPFTLGQKTTPTKVSSQSGQSPLVTDYRGITLGMTAAETVAKLGQPMSRADDQDFFFMSDKESAQVAYDSSRRVKTISVDYFGGTGAPDYKNVVGNEIQTKPDGSLYKLVRYESQRFWVSYNRTAGPVIIVTITIQKY